VIPQNSGTQTYVYYLFTKSKDLKDFEREPEAVKEKLTIKLRASAVADESLTPI
jgi:hypothetical protein